MWRESNPRPRPYQGRALPLSYTSAPTVRGTALLSRKDKKALPRALHGDKAPRSLPKKRFAKYVRGKFCQKMFDNILSSSCWVFLNIFYGEYNNRAGSSDLHVVRKIIGSLKSEGFTSRLKTPADGSSPKSPRRPVASCRREPCRVDAFPRLHYPEARKLLSANTLPYTAPISRGRTEKCERGPAAHAIRLRLRRSDGRPRGTLEHGPSPHHRESNPASAGAPDHAAGVTSKPAR